LDEDLQEVRRKLQLELQELVQLRPIPSVALQVLDACRQQEPDIKRIIELIECDPAISTRILALTNSPLYGYSREIASLNQAVVGNVLPLRCFDA